MRRPEPMREREGKRRARALIKEVVVEGECEGYCDKENAKGYVVITKGKLNSRKSPRGRCFEGEQGVEKGWKINWA